MGEVLAMPDSRRARLKELEAVIASGWDEVVRVGQALREIRNDGLYLELDGGITFPDYCKSRWSMADRTALQYMDAADVSEATRANGASLPILSERVGRELAPLLRIEGGGPALVAEAWAKISERFADQRPPTAREVNRVLIEEGYRPPVGRVSSGPINTRILLGGVGDKIAATEKRLDWFLSKDVKGRKVSPTVRALAATYAARCEALATLLRDFAEDRESE